MWHSTEQMTQSIARGVKDCGLDCKVLKFRATPYSTVVKEFWRARGTLIGSPTLNNIVFPTIAQFLTYLRGLRPKNRIVGAFGSFGWGGGAVKEVYETMKKLGLEVYEPGPEVLYRPSFEDEQKCYEFGCPSRKRLRNTTEVLADTVERLRMHFAAVSLFCSIKQRRISCRKAKRISKKRLPVSLRPTGSILPLRKRRIRKGTNRWRSCSGPQPKQKLSMPMHHLRVAGGIKSTTENLDEALNGESFEFQQMYPKMIEDAKAEGNKAATMTFDYANQVEKIHADLYKKAIDELGKNQETDYSVCQVCGMTVEGEAPDKCPVCGAPKSSFKKVD